MTVIDITRTSVVTTRAARGTVAGDGIRMAWTLWPGAGPAVVALHGVTAQASSFVGVAERLAGRRPLLGFDLRGRGDSDKPAAGPYGMSQHACDVAAAMRGFGLGRSVVLGHSMGAFVAAALAAEHPELVAGVVLLDGGLPLDLPPGIPVEQLLDVMLAPQIARLRASFPSEDAYLEFWRGLPHLAGERWTPWVEHYLRNDLGGEAPALRPKASEDAVRADFRDHITGDRLRERLAEISAPVLSLRAAEGFAPGDAPLLSDELVAREGARIRSFQDRVIAGTTHYTISLGEPGASAVADALVEFAGSVGR